MKNMGEINNRKKKKSMHPYIPHLLNDIRGAHRAGESSQIESFDDYIEEVERYI
jgi:hypothetical protein